MHRIESSEEEKKAVGKCCEGWGVLITRQPGRQPDEKVTIVR